MLEVSSLIGGWGSGTVVEGISFSIPPGEVVSIIGRNGVGKSTLLELLVGRANRKSGLIRLGSADLQQASTRSRALAGIGYVPQTREIFPSLTVLEHLEIAQRPGPWNQDRIFELFPSLRKRARNLASQLSGGEQQMVAIARALVTNPRVLIMDEPTEGLAPVLIDQLVNAVQTVIRDDALSVLLVEQRINIALALSTRCMVMDRGRIVLEEASATLALDPERCKSLIGLAH